MKKVTPMRIVGAIVVLLIIVFLLGPRARFNPRLKPVSVPSEPAELEKYIARAEARFNDITPKTRKRITWFSPTRKKTDLALVYVHGFGATRQEIAPVPRMVAKQLGANLYEARLRGHGRGLVLGQAKANQWLQDTEEAYQIGRRLGSKVMFLAMSTGSPLAISITHRHKGKDIAGLALLSPNFQPKDPMAGILLLPWGLQLARLVQGEYYQWKPRNKRMGIYWTTRHKMDVLPEMMALVAYANDINLAEIEVPALLIYTKHDKVIDPDKVKEAYARFGSPRKKLVDLPGATMHNIAGDILAPGNVKPVVELITDFMKKK